jgi:hypothetical protein
MFNPLRFLTKADTQCTFFWSYILFYLYIRWRSFLTYVAPEATVKTFDGLMQQSCRRQELHNFIQPQSQEFLNNPLKFSTPLKP